jgi:hypothetical protein
MMIQCSKCGKELLVLPSEIPQEEIDTWTCYQCDFDERTERLLRERDHRADLRKNWRE